MLKITSKFYCTSFKYQKIKYMTHLQLYNAKKMSEIGKSSGL